MLYYWYLQTAIYVDPIGAYQHAYSASNNKTYISRSSNYPRRKATLVQANVFPD